MKKKLPKKINDVSNLRELTLKLKKMEVWQHFRLFSVRRTIAVSRVTRILCLK